MLPALSESLHYTIGVTCPLITNSLIQFVLYYNISISDTLTVKIQCLAGNQVYFRECGSNGQWNDNLISFCSSSEITCKLFFKVGSCHMYIHTTMEVMKT